jgi:hypothetical protein
MCAWNDKWNALFKQNIAQECLTPASINQSICMFILDKVFIIFIFDRLIHRPGVYFILQDQFCFGVTYFVRSLDLPSASSLSLLGR